MSRKQGAILCIIYVVVIAGAIAVIVHKTQNKNTVIEEVEVPTETEVQESTSLPTVESESTVGDVSSDIVYVGPDGEIDEEYTGPVVLGDFDAVEETEVEETVNVYDLPNIDIPDEISFELTPEIQRYYVQVGLNDTYEDINPTRPFEIFDGHYTLRDLFIHDPVGASVIEELTANATDFLSENYPGISFAAYITDAEMVSGNEVTCTIKFYNSNMVMKVVYTRDFEAVVSVMTISNEYPEPVHSKSYEGPAYAWLEQ